MTVCIASICDSGQSILAVCDSKLSAIYTSSDRATLKARRVSKSWAFMYAAEDVSPVVPIEEKIKEEIASKPNRLAAISLLAQAAFLEQQRARARARNLVPQETKLELVLLFFGYDEQHNAHIFTVADPNGEITYHDAAGLKAVGSGGLIAEAILNSYGQNRNTSSEMGIYFALAAKFMAESATDVGRDTFAVRFKPNGLARPLLADHLNGFRAMWENEGKPRVPQNVEQEANKIYEMTEKIPDDVFDLLGTPPDWKSKWE